MDTDTAHIPTEPRAPRWRTFTLTVADAAVVLAEDAPDLATREAARLFLVMAGYMTELLANLRDALGWDAGELLEVPDVVYVPSAFRFPTIIGNELEAEGLRHLA